MDGLPQHGCTDGGCAPVDTPPAFSGCVDEKPQPLRAVNNHPPRFMYSVHGRQSSREGRSCLMEDCTMHTTCLGLLLSQRSVFLQQTLFVRNTPLPMQLSLACPEMLSNCKKILFWLPKSFQRVVLAVALMPLCSDLPWAGSGASSEHTLALEQVISKGLVRGWGSKERGLVPAKVRACRRTSELTLCWLLVEGALPAVCLREQDGVLEGALSGQ